MSREKRKVLIPNSWDGISIQMYQDFKKISTKKLKEEEFNLQVLSVICGLDKDMVKQMEIPSINKVLKTLKFLDKEMPNTEELVKKVEWNGKMYGFIPNLSEITMGEYIDIEEHCKNAEDNLHKIMSVLYRPIVKETDRRYSIEPYVPSKELEDEFLDFPILPSMSALSFFFHLGKKLQNSLHKYLKRETEKLKKEV
tara:strand:+ start:320 stop:910 length:591 start_codon:yes stop_codon:yes gene_type:complete